VAKDDSREHFTWFSKAIDLHVDCIELDVHLSADGEIIVIHDETLIELLTAKER
jgi:glycerophosphoryl diester phosphodiesterase